MEVPFLCKIGFHVWKSVWHLKYDQCPYCRKVKYWNGYDIPLYPKPIRDELRKIGKHEGE